MMIKFLKHELKWVRHGSRMMTSTAPKQWGYWLHVRRHGTRPGFQMPTEASPAPSGVYVAGRVVRGVRAGILLCCSAARRGQAATRPLPSRFDRRRGPRRPRGAPPIPTVRVVSLDDRYRASDWGKVCQIFVPSS